MNFDEMRREAALKDANELHGYYRQQLENARAERDAALLQNRDMRELLQDLRSLLAEHPKNSDRPFVMAAREKLEAFDQRYADEAALT